MNPRTRRGFTLIELLVVITIIGMLMALLMPAVQSSRESARRATCMNSQRNLGQAMLSHESYRGFPGYANNVGSVVASWVVPLFPYLEENPLWDIWRTGSPRTDVNGDGFNDGYVYLKLLTCPSDQPPDTSAANPPLAYVVNCGLPDSSGSDGAACGVFHDLSSGSGVRVSLDYLSTNDGSKNTLMLSETLIPREAGGGPSVPLPHSWAIDVTEDRLGFTWDPASTVSDIINYQSGVDWPRPASYHPGGVVATFCDNHIEFLAEDIDYFVYAHMMTPSSKTAADQTGYTFGGHPVFDPGWLE
jgi:prepilin-type N-terminal cleavage/methylation domain-containing protein